MLGRPRTRVAATPGRRSTTGAGPRPVQAGPPRGVLVPAQPVGARHAPSDPGPQREVLPHLAGGGRPVEGDEVDARTPSSSSRAHIRLACSMPSRRTASGSSATRSNRSASAPGNGAPESCSDRSIGGHLGHRHDPGDDRGVAAGRGHPVAQPQVVIGLEEHLGDRVVGPGPALADEVLRVRGDVRRPGVLVREGGHADAEVARARGRAGPAPRRRALRPGGAIHSPIGSPGGSPRTARMLLHARRWRADR